MCFIYSERISFIVLDVPSLEWNTVSCKFSDYYWFQIIHFFLLLYYFKALKLKVILKMTNVMYLFIYCVFVPPFPASQKTIQIHLWIGFLKDCKYWAFSKHCLFECSCQPLIQPETRVWIKTVCLFKGVLATCLVFFFFFWAFQFCTTSGKKYTFRLDGLKIDSTSGHPRCKSF